MRAVLILALVAGASGGAAAQDPVARADYLMGVGRVFAAESVYYWAATSKPRDPAARLALGRYLASRGSLRTAATLMEEARFFGGDPRIVAAELAPVYERLGEYRALASLPASPLSPAEQMRAEWLRDNRPTRRGPAIVIVPLKRAEPHLVGQVVVRIGRDSIVADIDPAASGLTLDTAWTRRRGIRRFAPASERLPERMSGVVLELLVGQLALGNVPVSFSAFGSADRAVVGLDFLSRLAPTFDEREWTLTLRPGGRIPPLARARRFPTLVTRGSYSLVNGTSVVQLTSSAARALLGGTRWTVGMAELLVE